MKTIRILFTGFVAASMLLLPGFLTGETHCRRDAEAREIFAGVHDLRKEITLHNLINGLYLSQDQIVQMLAVLRKDQVKKQGEGLREQFHGSMRPYQDEIKGILNANQLALINDFKPCVIPPRDTWDSARVGQASGDTRMGERFLIRVRQMDERAYQGRKSFIIERHIERVERHVGLLSDEERAEEEGRVADIFGKARELSDVDFEAQKGDLARELKGAHEKALEGHHRKRKGDLDKVGRFLLDPKLIPILEKRLTSPPFLFLDHLYGLLGAYGGTDTAPLTVVVVDLHSSRDLVPGDAEIRAEERADIAALAREGSQTSRGLGNGLLLGEPLLHQVEAPPPLFSGKGVAPHPVFPLELAGLGNHRDPSLIERN